MRFADYEMEKAVLGCMIADRSVTEHRPGGKRG